MEGLNNYQRQQLIDLKNRLITESDRHYEYASVTDGELEEKLELEASKIKKQISDKINAIIYNK